MASRSNFFRAALCLTLQLPALALVTSTAEAIPLLNGFGGPSGYGTPDHCVPPNDDGSFAGAIDLTMAFPMGVAFFGNTYRTFFLNNNGNITFRAALGTYTPMPFPVAAQPMIAPWWGDVDTRGGGMPARNNVCYHIEPGRVIATWNNVGYFSAHDNLQNDFQMILSVSNTCTTTGDFDVEFRYNRCEWTTGDASGGRGGFGGTPAQVGFDAGNRRDFVALPMSRMMSILDVCRQTNVPGAPPGLWRFQIRGGAVAGGCMGGGTACTVAGQRGACAQGVNVCDGMGVRCRALITPRDERCNGFDDNCDGMVDEGMGLCPGTQVCDRGACVDRCSQELGCLPGRTCTNAGVCVETACQTVMCPANQRCSAGQCIEPCTGVTCPYNQICRAGRCLDPCAGVTCNPREVCDPTSGLCVPGCQCRPCGAGQMCLPDGHCVDDGCAATVCPTGQYCRAGVCRDRCESGPDTRLCPSGEVCTLGECVPGVSRPDAGVTRPDSGTVTPTDGGRTDGGSVTQDSGVNPTQDSGTLRADVGPVDDGGELIYESGPRAGCGCRTTAPTPGAREILAGALFALITLARRRRR
jgi:MYXO-CTERM domain-containing protein